MAPDAVCLGTYRVALIFDLSGFGSDFRGEAHHVGFEVPVVVDLIYNVT